MTPIQRTLRTARLVHIGLLLWVLFALDAGYRVKPFQNQISPIMVYAITFVCLNDIGLAGVYRSRFVKRSEDSLRSKPFDESALKKWRQGVLTSLVMAYSIVLFGLLLKLMGATWNVAGWFFVAGALLLLAWTPRLNVSVAG
jgi:hypothetical protein